MLHSAEAIFLLDNAEFKILFYCQDAGKITDMADLLIDCYFNGFCKGTTNFVPTPRYAA
jgi:hypothetical protein